MPYLAGMFGEDESETEEDEQTAEGNQSIGFFPRVDHEEGDQSGHNDQVEDVAAPPAIRNGCANHVTSSKYRCTPHVCTASGQPLKDAVTRFITQKPHLTPKYKEDA
jgi:hypothetical protein